MFLYFHTFVSFWYIFYFHLFIIYVSDYVLLYMWLDVCVCLCVNVCIACPRAWIVIYIVLLTVWGEAGDAYSVASTSQAHRAGSFGKRRTLSIFHGFDIHNGYLKHTTGQFSGKKNLPKGWFRPSFAPIANSGVKRRENSDFTSMESIWRLQFCTLRSF